MKNHIRFMGMLCLLLTIIACKKDCEENHTDTNKSMSDLLLNDEGWYAYAHTYYEEGEEAEFNYESQPHLFLHFANAVRFDEDGQCILSYSDGSQPLPSALDQTYYEWYELSEDSIALNLFSNPYTDVHVKAISETQLWLSHAYGNGIYEYKLYPIVLVD